MQFRGGSSKGLFFLASDLPEEAEARNQLLLDAMGRDARQIDGLGGADPLTSKVAVVAPASVEGADVDFLFAQVMVGEDRVSLAQNCGNLLAAVGPFAVEVGLIEPQQDRTVVTVNMLNSDKLCELEFQTPGGQVEYEGGASIDGVPGTAAPIVCNYLDVTGAICGALLPTGNVVDVVDGVSVTCIDNGMPVIALRATDLDISGYESAEELNANNTLKTRLESIRLQMGPKMNLGDVASKSVPKMCLCSPAQHGGLINTRTFIPHKCHAAVGVLGAVSAASACILPGSVVDGMGSVPDGPRKLVSVEHPSGEFSVSLDVEETDTFPKIVRAGVLRTARLLCRGELFVPARD